jgi:excisionase family DNA binding protein
MTTQEVLSEGMISVPAAAGQMGVSPTTLYKLIAAGEIPCVRVGKLHRIPLAAWREFLENHLTGVTP